MHIFNILCIYLIILFNNTQVPTLLIHSRISALSFSESLCDETALRQACHYTVHMLKCIAIPIFFKTYTFEYLSNFLLYVDYRYVSNNVTTNYLFVIGKRDLKCGFLKYCQCNHVKNVCIYGYYHIILHNYIPGLEFL